MMQRKTDAQKNKGRATTPAYTQNKGLLRRLLIEFSKEKGAREFTREELKAWLKEHFTDLDTELIQAIMATNSVMPIGSGKFVFTDIVTKPEQLNAMDDAATQHLVFLLEQRVKRDAATIKKIHALSAERQITIHKLRSKIDAVIKRKRTITTRCYLLLSVVVIETVYLTHMYIN